MFGKNVLMKQDRTIGPPTYLVREVFPTIQGEGPFTGMRAVFVRLGGCNLRCHFCDTDFDAEKSMRLSLEELLALITEHSLDRGLVVLTGGEPYRQRIGPLIDELHRLGYVVQVETAGTLWDDTVFKPPHIVCSPKTPGINPQIAALASDYKYIVSAGDCDPEDGLPIFSTQDKDGFARLYRHPGIDPSRVWVQPREEYHEDGTPALRLTNDNIRHAVELVKWRGYRLSLQTHKILGLP